MIIIPAITNLLTLHTTISYKKLKIIAKIKIYNRIIPSFKMNNNISNKKFKIKYQTKEKMKK